MQELKKIADGCSVDDLIKDFNDQSLSDYIVVYLRQAAKLEFVISWRIVSHFAGC